MGSSMSRFLPIITKIVSSAAILSGLGMTAMGFGLIDVDPTLRGVAEVYTEPLRLPLKPFLMLLGMSKIWAVLRIWDKVPPKTLFGSATKAKNLGFVALACPPAAAIYGHHQAEGIEATIPPTVYLCILAACHYFENKQTEDDEVKKDD